MPAVYHPDATAMRAAIQKAREGIFYGQSPFGACIVADGEILTSAYNRVWADMDSTGHAEIICLRQACKIKGSVHLTGAVMYATCEPCPMCFAACHWADIAIVVYGAGIADAARLGFRELTIPNTEMKQRGGSGMGIRGGFLRDECLALFREWQEQNPRQETY